MEKILWVYRRGLAGLGASSWQGRGWEVRRGCKPDLDNRCWCAPKCTRTWKEFKWPSLIFHSLVFWFSLVFSKQGNSLVFGGFSAVFLCFSGVFTGVERGKKSLVFGVVFLGFYLNTKEWKIRVSDPRNRNHKSLAIGNHNFEVASFSRRNRSKIAVSQSQKSHWAKKIAAIRNHTLVVAKYSGGFPDPCGASETL